MASLEDTVALKQLLDTAGVPVDSTFGRMCRAALQVRNGKRVVAKLVRMLEARIQSQVWSQGVFALPADDVGSGPVIGQATDGQRCGGVVHVPAGDHLLVVGMTGQGKSHAVKLLLGQHLVAGGRVLVFDLEDEFRCLLAPQLLDQVWWVKPSWLYINWLRPPTGVALATWRSLIVDLLRSVYFMRDGATSMASTTLQELYERHGSSRGAETWPTAADWLVLLRAKKFAMSSQFQGHLETLVRVVTTLLDRFPRPENGRDLPLDVLMDKSVIVNCRGMAPQDLEFLICVLLAVPEQAASALPRRVVIEECHILLNRFRATRQDLTEPPLETALRRERKNRRAFVLVDQVISGTPESVIANAGGVVAFALRNEHCQRILGSMLGLHQEQKALLTKLPGRVAVVQSTEVQAPVLVRIPDVTFGPPMDHDALEHGMRAALAPWWPRETDGEEQVAAAHHDVEREPSRKEAPTNGSAHNAGKACASSVSLTCLKFLEHCNEPRHHLLSLGEHDAVLEFGLAEGFNVRQELTKEGLIELHPIKTGQRGGSLKTVVITDAGYRVLESLRITACKPRGKGSVDARFWQHAIARQIQREQPRAVITIEGRRADKAVDVLCEVDGKVTAYEVELSPKHVSQNVVKDLLVAGCDEVVICVLRPQDVKAAERGIGRGSPLFDNADDLCRVRCKLLREFLVRDGAS